MSHEDDVIDISLTGFLIDVTEITTHLQIIKEVLQEIIGTQRLSQADNG